MKSLFKLLFTCWILPAFGKFAAQVQITNVDAFGQSIYVTFNIIPSGNYPLGGDPLNFTSGGVLPAIADPAFVGLLAGVESSNLLNIDIWSQGGSSIGASNQTDYQANCTKVSNVINPQTGAKMKVGALAAAPVTEHTASAYEASYLNDLITGMAVFTKLL